jgi:ribose 5-phosphate isomerase B
MIVIANDHAGIELKKEIMRLLDELHLPFRNIGTDSPESTPYPLWGYRAAKLIASGECDRGIAICGTGIGISLTANKVKGIRCAACADCFTAKLSREHNNANMLALGARVLGPGLALLIVRTWLEASFQGGRHAERVNMITAIEEGRTDSLT